MPAWSRLRAHTGLWTLVGLLGVAVVFLASAIGPVTREFEDRALRQLVAQSPTLVRDVTAIEPTSAHPVTADRFRSDVAALLLPELAGAVDVSWGIQRTQVRPPEGTFPGLAASIAGDGVVTEPAGLLPLASLHHQTDLMDEITMVAGVPPATEEVTDPTTAVIQVMAAEPVADALGLRVGESYQLLLGAAAVEPHRVAELTTPQVLIELTGVFSARDPADPVWEFDPRLLAVDERLWPIFGGDPPLRQGTLVTDQRGIQALDVLGFDAYVATLSVARFRLDESRLDAEWAEAAGPAVTALTVEPRLRHSVRIQTGLVRLIDDFLPQAAAARAVAAVVTAGLVGIAGGLLVIAARITAVRRRAELALLRARGGSVPRVVGRVTLEALLVMLPAAAAGWLLHLPLPGSAGAGSWLGVGAAPLLAATVTVLAVPVVVAVTLVGEPPAGAAPDRSRSRLVRVTVELLVLLLAGLGVLLLHQRGVNRVGTDAYLSVVPLLIGAAAGVLALRLYPWPLRVLGALAARGRGVVGFLGLARAGRAAPAAALPLLVVALAVAVGGFAGAVSASVGAARDAAALAAVGADIRVDARGITDQAVEAVAAVPGVVEVAPVRRDAVLREGPRTVHGVAVVMVDAAAYQRVLANLETAAQLPDEIVSAAPGTEPLPVLASHRFVTGEFTVEVDRDVRPVVVVGDVAGLPGVEQVENWLLVPRQALTDPGPTHQLLIVGPEADPAAVRAAVERATGLVGVEMNVMSRAEQRAALATSGLNRGLTVAFLAGAAGAAVGGLLAVGLAMVAQAATRGRALSLLRTMGMSTRQARGVLLVELVPVMAVAVAFGAAAGAAMPVLLAPALGLTAFTGGARVPVGLDLRTVVMLGVLLAVFVVGAALAEAAMNRRLGLGQVLRVD